MLAHKYQILQFKIICIPVSINNCFKCFYKKGAHNYINLKESQQRAHANAASVGIPWRKVKSFLQETTNTTTFKNDRAAKGSQRSQSPNHVKPFLVISDRKQGA